MAFLSERVASRVFCRRNYPEIVKGHPVNLFSFNLRSKLLKRLVE
jgi:hypothetical protein